MDNRPAARESRSVRLSDREWAVADAIGRLAGNECYSAGRGIRQALRIAEQHFHDEAGLAFARLIDQAQTERSAGGE